MKCLNCFYCVFCALCPVPCNLCPVTCDLCPVPCDLCPVTCALTCDLRFVPAGCRVLAQWEKVALSVHQINNKCLIGSIHKGKFADSIKP